MCLYNKRNEIDFTSINSYSESVIKSPPRKYSTRDGPVLQCLFPVNSGEIKIDWVLHRVTPPPPPPGGSIADEEGIMDKWLICTVQLF